MSVSEFIKIFVALITAILNIMCPGAPSAPPEDVVLTPDVLEELYEFTYYEDIATAINDINTNQFGVNSIENNENVKAGVYIDNEEFFVVLMEDTELNSKVLITEDMTINLGGNTVTFYETYTGFDIRTIDDETTEVTIDGQLDGSSVEIYSDNAAAVVNYANTEVDIVDGTYIARSYANDVNENFVGPTGRKYQTRVLYCATDGTMNINDAEIVTSIDNGNGYGIVNYGTLDIKDSTIYADAKYSDDGTNYIYLSVGIQNAGLAYVTDCIVTGTHSAISSNNVLYVDGGEYQSVGHGGIYISGNGKTSYVKNATMKAIEYNGQYELKPTVANNVGFYVGGNVGQDNLTVYVDNCTFYGTRAPFALRGSSGEKNNVIYISNSNINSDAKIRIDNDTHTLYIGKGNNFTADNTTRPARCVVTEEVYS